MHLVWTTLMRGVDSVTFLVFFSKLGCDFTLAIYLPMTIQWFHQFFFKYKTGWIARCAGFPHAAVPSRA